jgi:transposase
MRVVERCRSYVHAVEVAQEHAVDQAQAMFLLQQENTALKAQVAKLTFELDQLKRMIFGAKSERFVPAVPGQVTLFEVQQSAPPPTQEISYTRTKAQEKEQPVRLAIAAHLPRVEEVIEPIDVPEGARKIGEEITEVIEYKPGTAWVRRIVRPKYAAPERVVVAALPSLPFPKSNLGASLAAYICVSKFCDHLPLHRQRQMLARSGLEVSDSTIGGWFKSAATLLEPLQEKLKNEVLAQDYLQVDESPIPVQDNHQENAIRKGYHWVYHAPLIRTVLFDYRPGRSAEFPTEVLRDFHGALQTDGYAGYEKLAKREGVTALACMAHARRKFEAALTNDKARAEHALLKIGELYALERHCHDEGMDHALRHHHRSQHAVPLLDELEQWIKQEIIVVAPKSPIGVALAYTLTLWPRLRAYTQDGRYLIDNNRVENTIRPMAVGRKNYLFAGSDRGARNAALMYSLLGTCKLHDVEPFAYLCDVVARISDHKANKLHELLPQHWSPISK